MKVSHALSETLSVCFEKTPNEFFIHFYESDINREKPGTLSGKDLGKLLDHLKLIYQMYRAWYKFRKKQ